MTDLERYREQLAEEACEGERVRPEDDWIKLPDEDPPADSHERWERNFFILLALIAVGCAIAALNGTYTP